MMNNSSNSSVLIIDGNSDFHDVVRHAVTDIGLPDCRACISFEEAQRALKSNPAISIIIMEVNQGGSAPLNFMRQIRAGKTSADKFVPIIIMTRALAPETAFSACEIGFEHFIRKPFNKEALQKRVTSVLQKPRRFVVARAYFGPDRRDPNSENTYDGEERRSVKSNAPPQASPPARKAKAPADIASGGKNDGSAVPDVAPKQSASPKKIPLADEAAVAKSAEAKKQLKAAPKSPPVDPLAQSKAAPPQPEKNKIELADEPKKSVAGPDRDRAAEIAAKLEAHAVWLLSQASKGEKANFADEDLSGADLAEANLANANFRNADLQDANLYRANLFDADLRGANLSGANLTEADIQNAKLRHTNLKAAQLSEAELRAADLSGANLTGAQLAGVDFKDAIFLSTNICGADMQGGNLTQKQIDNAKGDQSTLLPAGIMIKAAQ